MTISHIDFRNKTTDQWAQVRDAQEMEETLARRAERQEKARERETERKVALAA